MAAGPGQQAVLLLLLAALLALLLPLAVVERVRARRQAHQRRVEARYRAMVDQSSDLVLVTDRQGRILHHSPATERLRAKLNLDDVPDAWYDAALGADRLRLLDALATVSPDRPVSTEIRAELGGTVRTFALTVQDLTDDPDVAGLILCAHEITDRLALRREIEHRTMHDALTGLPNRVLLADRLHLELSDAESSGLAVALLLIDLDRFKEVNDTLGHQVGDELLCEVARRLTTLLGVDDTVARLGGDEFAVLLPRVSRVEDAVAVAEHLRHALNQSYTVAGIALGVDASIGLVLSDEHGTDPGDLLQRADVAMYAAKGRNQGVAVYDAQADPNTPDRLALLGDLRRGLTRGELVLYYQPKVNLRTGELCGVEALLRWDHPRRGLVAPDVFIPLAENTGLIAPLTEYVLERALRQARAWQDAGKPLQTSVNLSARNLLDNDLDKLVIGLLRRFDLDPALLKLEITESAIMADPARAQEILVRLDAAGVSVSLDDFGAGYTSIGQLKTLPISELKVDRSFVGTMDSDRSNSVIVRSMIELSHNLGITAVAEGVENVSTLDSLQAAACDVAQGFHLSRPLPVDAFDLWRAQWRGLPDLATGVR